ncbi:MAG: oleate hydratase, partial [Nitrospirota bacterium]
MNKVIIIGGGFAGLSAATELITAGYHVTIIEQRRSLGGRAYSFFDKNTGLELDNGQHILMGCYENTFRFLEKIGVSDKLCFQKNLSIDFLYTTGNTYRLDCLPLPAPFHILSGILRFKAISLSERIRMLNMAKGVMFGNATNSSH